MSEKARLSATVDRALLTAGRDAVEAGEVDSLSAWVNAALTERAAHDRRLRALRETLRDYEAEYGAFTEAELAHTERSLRATAVRVRAQ